MCRRDIPRGVDVDMQKAETAAELSWMMTLAVVSLLSAAIGAAVMVTVLHCRSRLAGFGSAGLCTLCVGRSHAGRVSAPTSPGVVGSGEDKEAGVGHVATPLSPQDVSGPLLALWRGRGRSGVGAQWPWRRREAGPGPGGPTCKVPAPENHYTLEELAYSGGASDEALYAELDRPSLSGRAAYQYQNAAPLAGMSPPCHCGQGLVGQGLVGQGAAPAGGPDTPSAPSSAYYSDLSAPDRTYEAVGVGMPCLSLQVNPHWEAAAAAAEAARRRQLAHQHLQRQFQQLQHIQLPAQQLQQLAPNDSAVPSDYV
ncbi:Bifunctional protein HldE [Frankliniella fusca]|uniref:Bifunctional protein HldE n=1 Tax=Frankliniella fusca TaxID=407009 RepID=A0AAE1HHL3_9NEOP|nr:Bifunctional protein HldE [Frankliniella fusca]